MKIKELDELVDDVKDLTTSLDEMSEIFKQIEEILERENKFKIEFSHQVEFIQGTIISWQRIRNSKKKKCRLYVRFIDRDIEKPIGDLSVELKIEVSQYVFIFLKEFRRYMKEKTEEAQDAITKMKMELECL